LTPEQWGSSLVQEKYQGEMACDKRQHNNNNSNNICKTRCLRQTIKIFQNFGHEEYTGQRASIYGRSRTLLKVTVGRKRTA
jgi:hypothetical protein